MIYCRNCGYEGIYTGPTCPECHEKIVLTEAEIMELKHELAVAKNAGEFETVLENYVILADAGDTDSEREYAKMLEKGSLIPRDIDRAAEFFFRAAEKCDPYSAYRYSRLASRVNDGVGKFWLAFSAILGCADAYLGTAEYYAANGKDAWANHYYYLAAMGDDVDAIVKLAERYYNGTGIEQSTEYAKWYMDKLTFPPLYALKLAYKLRGAHSAEAPQIICESYDEMIESLIGQAKKFGFHTAEAHLHTMLAERGSPDAMCDLAEYYLFNDNNKNPEEAIRVLTHAAATGSARAYTMLGLIYRSGAVVRQNIGLAISSFEHAAELGNNDAYEYLGDIYHNKDYTGRDVAKACEYYERAARGGSESADTKAKGIRSAREGYYYHATRVEDTTPEEAFRGYMISAMMGYPYATLKIAECYALGIGTERNRREAYVNYKKAVDSGIEEAYLPLGICYSRGIGVSFDFDLAVKYLNYAHRSGDERAKRELRRIYENKKRHLAQKLYSTAMRLIHQKKFAEAASCLNLALSFSHAKATYTLGCLYEFGRGVAVDKQRAYELYNAAEKISFRDARSSYKSSILKMLKKR